MLSVKLPDLPSLLSLLRVLDLFGSLNKILNSTCIRLWLRCMTAWKDLRSFLSCWSTTAKLVEKMFHSVVDCLKAKTSAPATWPQLQLMHWVWEGHRKGSWHGWRSLNSFIVWFMWRCIVAEYNDMMEMSVWLLNKIMAKGPRVLWITWWCWLYLFGPLYAQHSELTVRKAWCWNI